MADAALVAGARRRLDILLVDDDDDIREIAALALQLGNLATVRSCSNGSAALREMRIARPDLLLLDVMMPGLDGPATLAEIHRIDVSPPPVIFLTAKMLPAEVERLRQLGANDVISKPFDPMRLLDQVLSACENLNAS